MPIPIRTCRASHAVACRAVDCGWCYHSLPLHENGMQVVALRRIGVGSAKQACSGVTGSAAATYWFCTCRNGFVLLSPVASLTT